MEILLETRQNCYTEKSLREKYTKNRSNSDIAIANEVRMNASKAFSPRTGHTMPIHHFWIFWNTSRRKFFPDTTPSNRTGISESDHAIFKIADDWTSQSFQWKRQRHHTHRGSKPKIGSEPIRPLFSFTPCARKYCTFQP